MKTKEKRLGLILMVVGLVISLFLLSGVAAKFVSGVSLVNISGSSMSPAMKDGTKALYKKLDSHDGLKRYDIVIINNGAIDEDTGNSMDGSLIVKRVIALPGDDITVINGELYINDEYYEEPYVDKGNREIFNTEAFRYVLGEDEYFVMGDNRDKSNPDSRVLGPIPKDSLVGLITRPMMKTSKVKKPGSGGFQPPVDDEEIDFGDETDATEGETE